MSLANLYLLRIIQIEVYLDILQLVIRTTKNPARKFSCKRDKERLLKERKDIRIFLNMTELWRLRSVN